MILSHKIALCPNNKQANYFARASGTARFAYNWALSEWSQQYQAHQADPSLPKPSQFALRRQLNAIKKEKFPWMLEVTKNAPQQAIIQLGTAFKNFFKKYAGYPKFRKKGVDDRFSLTNDQFSIAGKKIHVPKLGWVRMQEHLRFRGKIISATISRKADRWFVSIAVELPDLSHLPRAKNQGAVGVDLGITTLATLSTGEAEIPNPHALRKRLKQLQRLSRDLSRKKKGSNNFQKARKKLARLHAHIANIRQDVLHKLTTDLTRRFNIVAIEDLNVKGMLKNRKLSRAIADVGFFEFRRQLQYKAEMRGVQVVVANRWYASSKICSSCGYKLDELALAKREWVCPKCAVHHKRDVNAAINLKNMAVSSIVNICGEEGAGCCHQTVVKPALMKQKVNTNSYL